MSLEGMERAPGGQTMHRRRALAIVAISAIGIKIASGTAPIAEAARVSGRKIARVALRYKGAKYKMGGESPHGFDCSGFTWFIYDKVADMDIGRTVTEQWKRGHKVSRRHLKKGDIVFFENTFERGLSHCGISLGDSEFIHAENEQTGVVISDLASGYYRDHYAGARRLL